MISRSYENEAIVLLYNDDKWLAGETFNGDFYKGIMMIKTNQLFLLMKING